MFGKKKKGRDKDTTKDDDLAACAPPELASATTVKFNAGQFVSRRQDKISKHYQIKKQLGSGGYGEVFLAKQKNSGAERAIKVVDKTRWNSSENEAVINEFNIVKDLDHPNLLKMYEMYDDPRHFYIVTDVYKGGELFDEIEANGAFTEEDAAVLLMNVMSCVNYFHSKHIVHRDLKPENILLTKSKKLDDLKIIDFGLACHFHPEERLTVAVGSSYYKAPEVLFENYSFKCDIWSCGVICFILLGGYAPFDGETDEEIEEAIRIGEFDFDDPIWDMVSDDAKDFIEECLQFDESDRPTAAEALAHPWLENCRRAGHKEFARTESDTIQDSLKNLASFHAHSKLKQATCAFIAAQLLMKEEKEAIDEVFRALDRNCDGKLTPDEIKEGYAEFFDKELSDDEVNLIFSRVNFRGTGAIDYSEFIVASMFEKNLLDDKRLDAAFKMFDNDGDGYIDAENIKKVLHSFGTIEEDMDEYINNKIIKEFDHDGDGRISFGDFKHMMFQTVQEQPKKPAKRRSLISAIDRSFKGPLIEEPPIMALPGNLCISSSSHGSAGRKPRSGSLKDVKNAFQAMSLFESAKDPSGGPGNALFKLRGRFGSVRGAGGSGGSQKKKNLPPRTTTREVVAVDAGRKSSQFTGSYSGELPFTPESILGGTGGGLLDEDDGESDEN